MSTKDIAQWMVQQVEKDGILTQRYAVSYIYDNFGDNFYHYDEKGNLCISKQVLKEFRKISENLVWSAHYKGWRKRELDDEPNLRKVRY